MQIDTSYRQETYTSNSGTSTNNGETFANIFETVKAETLTDSMSSDVEEFSKNLREKGSLQFLLDFNEEKIEELLEDFKDGLMAEMGDSPEAMARIEEMVENLRKQLMEMHQEVAKLEDTEKDEETGDARRLKNSLAYMLGNESSGWKSDKQEPIVQELPEGTLHVLYQKQLKNGSIPLTDAIGSYGSKST